MNRESDKADEDDLVAMCRDPAGYWNTGLRFAAADEIERLRAQLAAAEAALKELLRTIDEPGPRNREFLGAAYRARSLLT